MVVVPESEAAAAAARPKPERVLSFLNWIAAAPGGGLESAGDEPPVLVGVDEVPWATAHEVDIARDAVARVAGNENISIEHADALEAIVLPKERPVVDIVDGTYVAPGPPFEHLGDNSARGPIEAAIPSVGRIELPDHPSLPYGGTGFVVGDDLLMTNRHVAEIFADGLGREELSFHAGRSASVDFLREHDRSATKLFRVKRIAMIHPYWDMALLVTEGLSDVPALSVSVAKPEELQGREIVVIGYPALDPRNNMELQSRIFAGVFNVKRLQPGRLRGREQLESFGHDVSALTHDSSTLAGNSGSAVIDVETGRVVALHFAGIYLKANYAVPTYELARDSRVVDARLNFERHVAGGSVPWASFWDKADPIQESRRNGASGGEADAGVPTAAVQTSVPTDEGLSWSLPLELTVQLRHATPGSAGPGAVEAGVEAMVEPYRDDDYSSRTGFDVHFLPARVRLPTVVDKKIVSHLDDGGYVLEYEHFSVVMNKQRRLALFTASNVAADKERKKPEANRDYSRRALSGLGENDREKWFTDPRIPAIHQLPDRFFTKDRASFDKGHIVRREDVAWGESYDELRRANGDTYHVTNCSPQVARFNQSSKKGLWGRLENFILAQAKTEQYSLFAGPVFRDNDRTFRGVDDEGTVHVQIPSQFWKVVVAHDGIGLQTFAFVLDQDLSHTDLELVVDAEWRSRMISIEDLQELAALIKFPSELHNSDQYDTPGGESLRSDTDLAQFASEPR
jgi:endonuclease G